MRDVKQKSRVLVNKVRPRSVAEVQAIVEPKLRVLENEIGPPLKFDQEPKTKQHMYFTGGNGRIYIRPLASGSYDISLSGQSLTGEMSTFMNELCNTEECSGYKQKNSRIGEEEEPFWRVDDFKTVEKAVRKYATTRA